MAGIVYTDFARWLFKNGWKWHDTGYWYKGNSWPPEQTATDKEILEMYFN